VVRFVPQNIPGYRNLFSLARYFVSDSGVYVLEMADKIDPSDYRKTIGRSYLIDVFDYKGKLEHTVFLEPGVNPFNLAAFESGDILVLSLDNLNHATRFLLFDPAGRPESELRLLDEDFGTRRKPRAGSTRRMTARRSHDYLRWPSWFHTAGTF